MNGTLKGTLAVVGAAALLTLGCVRRVTTTPGTARSILAGQEKTVWDGVYTEAQAMRGEQLYLERCVTCHGVALEGTELAPSLAGDEFALNWNDLPLNELSERIRVTMPQDQPGVLNRQQTADTVGFMLSKGGFPAGSEELGAAPGALSSIQFLAKKP